LVPGRHTTEFLFDEDKILVAVGEGAQGVDLNGDGDLYDHSVIHVLDVRGRKMTNLRRSVDMQTYALAVGHCGGSPLVGIPASESGDGRDYDGNDVVVGDVVPGISVSVQVDPAPGIPLLH